MEIITSNGRIELEMTEREALEFAENLIKAARKEKPQGLQAWWAQGVVFSNNSGQSIPGRITVRVGNEN